MNDISFKVWISNRFSNKNTAKQYLNCYKLWTSERHNLDQAGVENYINNHNHGLSRAFIRNLMEYNNVKDINIPNPRSRKGDKIHKFIEFDVVMQFIKELPVKESIMVRLYFETGLRLNELINVQVKDINLLNRTISGIGKGNKPFEEKFSPKSKAILTIFLAKFDRIACPFKYEGVTHSDKKFWYILKKKGKEMGYPDIHPHRFRHALGHHLRSNCGLDLEEIRVKLRHIRLETVKIYAAASKEEVDKKIDKEVFENE